MSYTSISDARAHDVRVVYLLNEIKRSARIIQEYERCGEPQSSNRRKEIETYARLMIELQNICNIPGRMVFYNWKTKRFNTKPMPESKITSYS